MIDLQNIASYVVSSGDGDRCGPFELLAAIQSRHPDNSADEVLEACRSACTSLAAEGHVRLEMTPPHADRPTRDGYTAIPDAAVEGILRDPESWQSPRDARPRYWLVATETGKAAYISEDVVSL
jgi:hypothetical protein